MGARRRGRSDASAVSIGIVAILFELVVNFGADEQKVEDATDAHSVAVVALRTRSLRQARWLGRRPAGRVARRCGSDGDH